MRAAETGSGLQPARVSLAMDTARSPMRSKSAVTRSAETRNRRSTATGAWRAIRPYARSSSWTNRGVKLVVARYHHLRLHRITVQEGGGGVPHRVLSHRAQPVDATPEDAQVLPEVTPAAHPKRPVM
jgi:hypothetical protein